MLNHFVKWCRSAIVYMARRRRQRRCNHEFVAVPSTIMCRDEDGQTITREIPSLEKRCPKCLMWNYQTQITDPNFNNPPAEVIGLIGEGVELIRWQGQYHLISGNGYLPEDIDFTFPEPPRPEPPDDDETEENPEWFGWSNLCELIESKMKFHPQMGRFLLVNFEQAGFGPKDGRLSYWLTDYCGRMIASAERLSAHPIS